MRSGWLVTGQVKSTPQLAHSTWLDWVPANIILWVNSTRYTVIRRVAKWTRRVEQSSDSSWMTEWLGVNLSWTTETRSQAQFELTRLNPSLVCSIWNAKGVSFARVNIWILFVQLELCGSYDVKGLTPIMASYNQAWHAYTISAWYNV